MILSVDELMVLPEFANQDADLLQKKLDALEILIRKYTNNNFQNRNIRFYADSEGHVLNGVSPFLKVGDTIQISDSGVNDGLYVITAIGADSITVDKEMFTVVWNMVTKVEYPIDVQMGIINLMKWEVTNRDKIGIKSESLSRHSVTYFDLDANNQHLGYPVAMLGFLDLYKKVRF
jgi:hypothetical protein